MHFFNSENEIKIYIPCITLSLKCDRKLFSLSQRILLQPYIINGQQYLLKIQVSRLQPSAPSKMSLSDPTFVLRYLCHAKSHSSCPPTRIAVQYTTFFRLADMLFRQRCQAVRHVQIFSTF